MNEQSHDEYDDDDDEGGRTDSSEIDTSARSGSDNIEDEIIPYYNENDIISHQTRTYDNNHGNLMFKLLIITYLDEYEIATRGSRMKINIEILQKVKTSYLYGRFLKERTDGTGGWIVLKDAEARAKISHAIKHELKKRREQQQQQQQNIQQQV